MKFHGKLTLVIAAFVLMACFRLASAQIYVAVNANQPSELIGSAGSDTIICLGDTISIGGNPTATGGSPAYAYSWFPSFGLSDDSVANPVASSGSSTSYILSITDARNCSETDTITILVDTCPNGIFAESLPEIRFYPNPASGEFMLEISKPDGEEIFSFELCDALGITWSRDEFQFAGKAFRQDIPVFGCPAGTYIIRLHSGEWNWSRRIVIMQ